MTPKFNKDSHADLRSDGQNSLSLFPSVQTYSFNKYCVICVLFVWRKFVIQLENAL